MRGRDVEATATRAVRLLRLFRRASHPPEGPIAMREDACRSCGSQLSAKALKCIQCGSVRDRPAPNTTVGLWAR
jgi:ribosomal protein L40E